MVEKLGTARAGRGGISLAVHVGVTQDDPLGDDVVAAPDVQLGSVGLDDDGGDEPGDGGVIFRIASRPASASMGTITA